MQTFLRELTLLAAVTAAGAVALVQVLPPSRIDPGSLVPIDERSVGLELRQLCARRAALLGSSASPRFEFQVDHPARFLGARGRPRPAANAAPSQRALVHFVVDTAGNVVVSSLKVLHVMSDSAPTAAAIRRAARGWRYSPAVVDGCATPQIVQTNVEP